MTHLGVSEMRNMFCCWGTEIRGIWFRWTMQSSCWFIAKEGDWSKSPWGRTVVLVVRMWGGRRSYRRSATSVMCCRRDRRGLWHSIRPRYSNLRELAFSYEVPSSHQNLGCAFAPRSRARRNLCEFVRQGRKRQTASVRIYNHVPLSTLARFLKYFGLLEVVYLGLALVGLWGSLHWDIPARTPQNWAILLNERGNLDSSSLH